MVTDWEVDRLYLIDRCDSVSHSSSGTSSRVLCSSLG